VKVDWESHAGRVLERVLIAVCSLALSVGLIAILSGYFAGKDSAGISGSSAGPGQVFRDLGDAHLPPGRLQPPYDSDPPTSGPHVYSPVVRDEQVLSNNQLLTALEQGNVVIVYGTRMPPAGLRTLADSIMAGPFTPALATSGGAVILARRPGTSGLIGLAWAHMVPVSAPNDPLLRQFAQYWLGRGAPGKRSLPSS
jgi:hypothetical protein